MKDVMELRTRMQLWKDMGGNLVEKQAELAATYDMPASPSGKTKNSDPGGKKAVIQKTASVSEDDLLKLAFDAQLEDNDGGVSGDNITKQPQAKELKPTVDTTSHEPPKLITEKKASRYAMPSQGKYPLDGYDQVKMASAYFDEWYKHMLPDTRREFCQNMVKRAHELGISVSPLAEQYAGETFASPAHIKVALDARRSVLLDQDQLDTLDKVAAARPVLTPDGFAATLSEFDRLTGLEHHYGGDIPDPYVSTFAKLGHESDADPHASIVVGNEYLPLRDLITFSRIGKNIMAQRFGDEIATAFTKNPKAIFDSLPRDQKLVIMRMASATDAQQQSATKS